MTVQEIEKYKKHIDEMFSEETLYKETLEVIRQRDPLLMQLCYNQWKKRNKGEVFLKAYNECVKPVLNIDHEFV